MADFEKALLTELKAISALNNHVYPINAPQAMTVPYLTYSTSGPHELKAFEGYLTAGSIDVTLDIMAGTYPTMKSLAAQVEQKVKSFLGRTIGGTGPRIQNITFAEYNPEMWEPEVNMFRKVLEFSAFFDV